MAVAAKLDLKALHKAAYKPAPGISFIDVPAMAFLMIDGAGDPNVAPVYREAVEALFSVAYTAKFTAKAGGRPDFAVMPLEGLWWARDMATFLTRDKSAWSWTMMIAVPDYLAAADIAAAKEKAAAKRDLPAVQALRLERFDEGRAVQTLHLGSYDDEAPVISAMHRFAEEHGHALRGKHHEIYLSDPRRTAPEKLKTILRQPVG